MHDGIVYCVFVLNLCYHLLGIILLSPGDNGLLQEGIICGGDEPDLHTWSDHLDSVGWCL